MTGAYLYILRCADGSFYVGTTRKDLDARVAEQNSAAFGGYTSSRRPVTLVFAEYFERITDAVATERRVKGWSRIKKEALIRGDWQTVRVAARRRRTFSTRAATSFETAAARPPQDEAD